MVASCVETAFYNTLLKERWKEGQLSLGGVVEDLNGYLVTLRKREKNLKEEAIDRTL